MIDACVRSLAFGIWMCDAHYVALAIQRKVPFVSEVE